MMEQGKHQVQKEPLCDGEAEMERITISITEKKVTIHTDLIGGLSPASMRALIGCRYRKQPEDPVI